MNSLYFKIKDSVDIEKHRFIELFFKDWVDGSCNREVQYKIERNIAEDWNPGMVRYRETFRVDFERQEDCLALKLKGVPTEFENFIELVK